MLVSKQHRLDCKLEINNHHESLEGRAEIGSNLIVRLDCATTTVL